MEETVLLMKGISKSFPGVQALKSVDLISEKVRFTRLSVKMERENRP